MSEKLVYPVAPDRIGQDLVGDEEDYDYGQIIKGIVHAIIVPFLIAFIDPAYSLVYVLCAALLYSTVFRHKSEGFWGTIVFTISMAAMMIVPN